MVLKCSCKCSSVDYSFEFYILTRPPKTPVFSFGIGASFKFMNVLWLIVVFNFPFKPKFSGKSPLSSRTKTPYIHELLIPRQISSQIRFILSPSPVFPPKIKPLLIIHIISLISDRHVLIQTSKPSNIRQTICILPLSIVFNLLIRKICSWCEHPDAMNDPIKFISDSRPIFKPPKVVIINSDWCWTGCVCIPIYISPVLHRVDSVACFISSKTQHVPANVVVCRAVGGHEDIVRPCQNCACWVELEPHDHVGPGRGVWIDEAVLNSVDVDPHKHEVIVWARDVKT